MFWLPLKLLTPFKTFVNGEPARLDNYGRLWSPSLKNSRFEKFEIAIYFMLG
jgi:hypothetical protein